MWAACLRHYNGKFYISFVANDTHKTYLFTSDKIEGPWKRSEIKGTARVCGHVPGKVLQTQGDIEKFLIDASAGPRFL